MILLSKKENEMNEEEKLKLEIMKTVAVAKGFEIGNNSKFDLDFREGSSAEKISRFLLAKFNISFKQREKKNDNKNEEEVIKKSKKNKEKK